MDIRRDQCKIERTPNEGDTTFVWSIKRASHEKPTLIVLLSRDIFGIRTHFFRGRTGPCLRADCEACAAKMLSRWTGYVAALENKNGAQILFEFTPPAAVILDKAFREYTSLRGLNVIATRGSKRANGKVQVEVRGLNPGAHKLPAEPDVWEVLSHLWGLREEAPGRFAEFEPDHLSELEKVQHGISTHGDADDNEWMRAKAGDLAGQLVLPPIFDERTSNGKH